jgi:5,10-methylenetetrahydromethanopterin reductase
MGWRWTDSPGLAVMPGTAPVRVTEWARAAEQAGLGSLWIVEDYFNPGAFALAGAAAAVTERLVIGLGVVNPYTRHPALVAMETAALAGLAPGRIVLGLGSSNRRWIEEQLGIPFKSPLETLRESVAVVRRLLAGERLTLDGAAFHLRDVALDVPPAGPPVPVFLGVKGPKALRLAGEIADGVHCSVLSSPGHVRRVRVTTAEARRAAGRRGAFPVIAYVPVVIDADRAAAHARLRPFVGGYLALLHGQSILADAGVPAALSLAAREALARGEAPGPLVPDELVEVFAVAGSPDDCRRALTGWADAGLAAPIAVPVPGIDVIEQLRRFRETLVPAWQALAARRRTDGGS